MVLLRTLGRVYDITEYVDRPYEFGEFLTGFKDMAKITLSNIKSDMFVGIDLSRKIPRMSVVEIERMSGRVSYYVEKADIRTVGKDRYEHELLLVEPKYLLENRPIPDTTITQPANVTEIIITETSRVTNDIITDDGEVGSSSHVLNFQVSQVSNDNTKIEYRVVKEAGEYTINFSITFGRINGIIALLNSIYIKLRVNGVVVKNYLAHNGSYVPYINVGTLAIAEKLTLNANDEIGVEIQIASTTASGPAWLNVKSGYLTIDKTDELTTQPKYMSDEVEKLLSLVNVSERPEFVLDETSKARLSTLLAYDDYHTEATLSTALERIASYVKARLYVDLKGGGKIVRFDFYDDMSKQDYIEPKDDTVISSASSDDYLSAVSLQNNNVIRENTLIEYATLRAKGDNNQITTDNIVLKTKYPIDKVKSVKVKGLEIKANDEVLLSDNEWLDITNNVIEKTYYDTLNKLANYDDRITNTQNNHIWFSRGVNEIDGLSFIGSQFDTWQPERTNRAIYETIATVIYRNDTTKVVDKWVDKKLDGDMSLMFEIEYYPMSSSNAYIYKDDQTGFQEKLIKRLNANDRVNNADYLGSYARTKVNSLGGTQISKKGIATDIRDITLLGTISPNNERVVSITSFEYLDKVEYYITLVKDYVFQSHYIGIDSDRRLTHIPKDEFVKRIDKSLNVIYLNKEGSYTNTSVIDPKLFLKSLNPDMLDKVAPKTALLNFDDKEITSLLDYGATANTIEWYLEMQDNYSAGSQRKVGQEGNINYYYQVGVPYSNIFGNVDLARVRVKEKQSDDKDLQSDMPQGDITSGLTYTDFTYNIKKDARELYALSIQTSILSNDDEIMVFNGIGKYNLMANNKKFNIGLAILEYKPNLDDKYIDLGNIVPQVNNAEINNGVITVNLSEGGLGYAFYEQSTNELILAVVKPINAGEQRLYYKAQGFNFAKGGRYEAEINIESELELGFSSVVELISGDIGFISEFYDHISHKVDTTLLVSSELELGLSNDYNLDGEIGFTSTYSDSKPRKINGNFIIDSNLELGLSNNFELLSNVEFIGSIVEAPLEKLDSPTLDVSATCSTTGYESNPTYTFRIGVTNNASVPVVMNVSIDGIYQQRNMSVGERYVFTRSRSYSWSSAYVEAYASSAGYSNSNLVSGNRSVSCPLPNPDLQPTLTWQYNGQSSSPFCLPAGYNPIGTSCTVSGQTMVVSGEDIGRPSGCYELICKI